MARLLASRATSPPGPLAGTRALRPHVEKRLVMTAGSHRISGTGDMLYLWLALSASSGDSGGGQVECEAHRVTPCSTPQ